ncbi:MAG: MFS transporter [Solirubrobacteraceae bacterium]
MSIETTDRGATRTHKIMPVQRTTDSGGWWGGLGPRGQKAFKAAFAGYTLDAFDLIILTLSLAAIGSTFGVGKGATGALATVTLSASAVGGILGGVLSDRIGRARTLMLTVGVYSVFTFLSGLASSYDMLLVFRVFQGIGFGGEWAVGAILVAELIKPEARAQIFRSNLVKTTVFASILATGIQGGYYAMFTWIPTYLKEERSLSVVGTSGYLTVVIIGAFLGYLSAGFVHDRLGRRKTFTLYAALAGVSLVAYFLVPTGSNTTLLIIGFPLGFFASGCFSSFGSYLAELYPTRARGTGAGFCYNVGRALGALFPGIIGFLAAAIGLGGAVAFGVFGYVLAIVALRFLPETHGKELVPVE